MQHTSLEYSPPNKPEAWSIERFQIGPIYLFVEKNATGKTRTLNVIDQRAGLISSNSNITHPSGNYRVDRSDRVHQIQYQVAFENWEIVEEELTWDRKLVLRREADGSGYINWKAIAIRNGEATWRGRSAPWTLRFSMLGCG